MNAVFDGAASYIIAKIRAFLKCVVYKLDIIRGILMNREIDLVDLLVEILLRWRVLLIWMLAGGILVGGYSFVKSYRQAEEQRAQEMVLEQQLQETKEHLETYQQEEYSEELIIRNYLRECLTERQKENVDRVLDNEEYCSMLQTYMKNSILMQIDGYKVPKVMLTFWVNAANAERSASVARIYEDRVLNGFMQWLALKENVGTEIDASSELITVDRSSQGISAISDSFCVSIVHLTDEKCVDLADKLIEYVNEQQAELQDLLGSHTIEVVNYYYTCATDIDLLKERKEIKDKVNKYILESMALKEAFSDAEMQYYHSVTDSDKEGMLTEYESVITPKISSRYVILGMLLFVLVYSLYVAIGYILNSKLRTTDDIKALYGITQLSYVIVEDSDKRFLSFIDHQILRLRNRNKRIFSEEDAIRFAAATLMSQAKKEELDEVFCIVGNLNEKTQKVVEKIQCVLMENGISMKILNSILYNQESIELLEKAKAVFLVEKIGETLYNEISDEIELVQRQAIKVLGAVVVE